MKTYRYGRNWACMFTVINSFWKRLFGNRFFCWSNFVWRIFRFCWNRFSEETVNCFPFSLFTFRRHVVIQRRKDHVHVNLTGHNSSLLNPTYWLPSIATNKCGRSLVRTRSRQIKDYEIGICCFSTKHATSIRRKSKDWLVRNQNIVSEWSDMSTRGLLFQWASTIKNRLSVMV